MRDVRIGFRRYRCFGDQEVVIDGLLPLTLVVGRNNSGKSSLIDLLGFAISPKDISQDTYHGGTTEVTVEVRLTTATLHAVARPEKKHLPTPRRPEPVLLRAQPARVPGSRGRSRAAAPPHTPAPSPPSRRTYIDDPWPQREHCVGQPIRWRPMADGKRLAIPPADGGPETRAIGQHAQPLVDASPDPLKDRQFIRLLSERRVHTEQAGGDSLVFYPDGRGATAMIQAVAHNANLDASLVEEVFLDGLNRVFVPETRFAQVRTKDNGNGMWEVYLTEAGKGAVALSKSGSGFQTVVLVLTLLHLVPYVRSKLPSTCVFAVEEPENNLHPAAVRRLLAYMRDFAVKNDSHVIVSTHSSVAIDFLSRDQQAQILHVQHDGTTASVRRVKTYVENCGILDDLDVRASDLLQANCVIWVEGPSDRVLIVKWIGLWSGGELVEGLHYQCVFYGGRLLTHLTATGGACAEGAVDVMKVNRRAILLMDSDLDRTDGVMDKAKLRMKGEVEGCGGQVWVTDGKEIENYLPGAVVAGALGVSTARDVGQFEEFPAYLDSLRAGEGKRYERDKVGFAAKAIRALPQDKSFVRFDLAARLDDVCARIRAWNAPSGEGSVSTVVEAKPTGP